MSAYAELQITSNFSFLEGASHAHELVGRAAALGLSALAITDRNSLAGVVRAHTAIRQQGLKDRLQLIIGARIDLRDGPSVLLLPEDRAAYGRLSQLISRGRRNAPKGECALTWSDLLESLKGQQVVLLPPDQPDEDFTARLQVLRHSCGDALSLSICCRFDGQDRERQDRLAAFAARQGVATVATNDVLYHVPERRILQDVMTSIRHGCSIDSAGYRLQANAERHLKSPVVMARLFARHPEAVARSIEIAGRCKFSLDELRYEYPEETKGKSATPQEELVRLTWLGARKYFPAGIPDKIRQQVEHELALIGRLNYAPYFLTVHNIVAFAKDRKILCQGRGSAANSVVCYCLGITAVNPGEVDLLFERFISEERREPPDIDVDFEHERREEVIQHIYETYTRERAGLAATVIRYQPRSAIRDVGKAMGLSPDLVDRLAKSLWGWGRDGITEDQIREAGIDPDTACIAQTLELAQELVGFPRHLSQHVGGFVISQGPLAGLVPIENAAMPDRTVIQWDKDDIDELGILKVDVLALGMLTCLRKAFDLIERHYGHKVELATVPRDDQPTYDMICKADTIGVFQIESRAQMSMLPRLKPRIYYDLVIQVAIVRPGPIQGDMVHPYLRRRDGLEKETYPKPELQGVLKKTLGVPLFQEQAMKIAIVAAGFTPSEADGLRRAMATFRHAGTIGHFKEKFIEGMVDREYDRNFAERCFSQIQGFGEYGFPESHAASFALLAYASAWMKCHYPAAFAAALLNSQPMGFYAPAQIVRDLRDHRGEIRPVDINYSDWDNLLEETPVRRFALRLGFRQVKGCRAEAAKILVDKRYGGYSSLRDLWQRTGLPLRVLELLARADAFGSLGLSRRQALWQIRGLGETPLPLFQYGDSLAKPGDNRRPVEDGIEEEVILPSLTTGEQVLQDYRTTSLTLRPHPLALLRPQLQPQGLIQAKTLTGLKTGTRIQLAGLVLVRQQPGTASGVIFVTLEDETGIANLIVWPKVKQRYRRALLGSRLLGVTGRVQSESNVTHVIAEQLVDYTSMLTGLSSLDDPEVFDQALANANEYRHPILPSPLHEVECTFPDGRNFR